MCVVIIPAYQPDGQLLNLVDKLHHNGLKILVVNDGSSEDCRPIFDGLAPKAQVLHTPHKGKGAALKQGFGAVTHLFPDCRHCITADADGQHRVEDILRVKEQLSQGAEFVLTVRKPKKDVPLRSRFGNALSRVVYTVMNGHYFDDNQSGLRGFSVKHLSWLTQVKGNKYDYEMNMLCHADKQNIAVTPLPIETIYIDGNKSSHFNPVIDTVRIYKRLFFSVWPSLIGVLVWETLTILFTLLFGYEYQFLTIPTAVMVSALLTYLTQKFIVFRHLPYRDGLRMLLFSVIRSAVYFSIVQTVTMITEAIPMVFVVNAAAVMMLVAEYYIHKRMHRVFKKK